MSKRTLALEANLDVEKKSFGLRSDRQPEERRPKFGPRASLDEKAAERYRLFVLVVVVVVVSLLLSLLLLFFSLLLLVLCLLLIFVYVVLLSLLVLLCLYYFYHDDDTRSRRTGILLGIVNMGI